MTTDGCPHGMGPSSCEICRVLGAPAHPTRAESPVRRPTTQRHSLGLTAVLVVVALVVFSWLAATIWAAVRLFELVAVAFFSGWVGWRLGLHRARPDR